jgi:thiazole synthase ThiGH ThiG subunit
MQVRTALSASKQPAVFGKIVYFSGGMTRSFQSRLLVGTGKYKDLNETDLAIQASGAEIVTREPIMRGVSCMDNSDLAAANSVNNFDTVMLSNRNLL